MTNSVILLHGDCRKRMAEMEPESVDAIVTDPPYGLSFMGKGWDHGVPGIPFWSEAYRVLKPGGHLLAFSGTRTSHRMVCAIEDAGFEIRDSLSWLYGSGFPKSLDVSKAIDKAAGAEREVVGTVTLKGNAAVSTKEKGGTYIAGASLTGVKDIDITAPATDLAKARQGWGTALKPAHEPICMARKPLVGTVAANVTEYGTGAINVDGCRIGTKTQTNASNPRAVRNGFIKGFVGGTESQAHEHGRWPANLILDEDAAAMLDQQSGERKSGGVVRGSEPSNTGQNGIYGTFGRVANTPHNDTGGASRFFYVAKASRRERNAGLDGMEERKVHRYGEKAQGPLPQQTPAKGVIETNHHPTVKPIALMRWLVRLVTPPGGVVLDPFMGSGTTGCAAALEGFDFIGIEQDAEYMEIAKRRIEHWQKERKPEQLAMVAD